MDKTKRLGAWAKAALLVVLALLVNAALTYALVPTGGMNGLIWHQYAEASDDEIDTLIVGSSYSMTINPVEVDGPLGSSTFTLATPSQSRHASLIAVQDGYEDHAIKRVIIGVSIGNMSSADDELMYDLAFYVNEGRARGAKALVDHYPELLSCHSYAGNTNSLAALVPWAVYHVDLQPSAIAENLHMKAQGYADDSEYGFSTLGRGFVVQGGHIDLGAVASRAVVATADEYELDEELMAEYAAINEYCVAHGIEVYYVVTPRPYAAMLRFEEPGGYALAMAKFEQAMTSTGAHFLDFSMTRSSYYQTTLDDYRDIGHLNNTGARLFSQKVGEVIAQIEAGNDVSDYFYPHTAEGWDEWCAQVEGIALVCFDATPRDGAIDVDITCWKGSQVEAEYEVSARSGEGDFEVVYPYGPEEHVAIETESHGRLTIRVTARRVGQSEGDVYSCEHEVLY